MASVRARGCGRRACGGDSSWGCRVIALAGTPPVSTTRPRPRRSSGPVSWHPETPPPPADFSRPPLRPPYPPCPVRACPPSPSRARPTTPGIARGSRPPLAPLTSRSRRVDAPVGSRFRLTPTGLGTRLTRPQVSEVPYPHGAYKAWRLKLLGSGERGALVYRSHDRVATTSKDSKVPSSLHVRVGRGPSLIEPSQPGSLGPSIAGFQVSKAHGLRWSLGSCFALNSSRLDRNRQSQRTIMGCMFSRQQGTSIDWNHGLFLERNHGGMVAFLLHPMPP